MYDVIVVGGGVIGCAILRELTRYRGRFLLLEKNTDVCEGSSKANSALVHGGFDAEPGSNKAHYNEKGSRMYPQLSKDLSIPYRVNGALVLLREGEHFSALTQLMDKAQKNKIQGVALLTQEETYGKEQGLADGITGSFYAATGAIVCPFETTYGLYENALANGAESRLCCRVTGAESLPEGFRLHTGTETYYDTKAVVNAAGLYADSLSRMLGGEEFFIQPRRGEYCLLDKREGGRITHTLFRLPTPMGKGILATPTIHGNLMVGPTAEDVDDREDPATSREGLDRVLRATKDTLMSGVDESLVITSFSGLRAHGESDDFIIGRDPQKKGLYQASCMESPGLSSAPAVGEAIAQMVAEDLSLEENRMFDGTRDREKPFSEMTEGERRAAIQRDLRHAHIVCRCETVTEAEVLLAIERGATTLDGIKRRCRSGMGRCQGGFCTPRVMDLLRDALGGTCYDLTKKGGTSFLVRYPIKEVPQ